MVISLNGLMKRLFCAVVLSWALVMESAAKDMPKDTTKKAPPPSSPTNKSPKIPAIKELNGDAAKGKVVFSKYCTPCHGENADGVSQLADSLPLKP